MTWTADHEAFLFVFRFLNSLIEEPEVVVSGAGQGKIGGIIHRLFVNVQEVSFSTSLFAHLCVHVCVCALTWIFVCEKVIVNERTYEREC